MSLPTHRSPGQQRCSEHTHVYNRTSPSAVRATHSRRDPRLVLLALDAALFGGSSDNGVERSTASAIFAGSARVDAPVTGLCARRRDDAFDREPLQVSISDVDAVLRAKTPSDVDWLVDGLSRRAGGGQ